MGLSARIATSDASPLVAAREPSDDGTIGCEDQRLLHGVDPGVADGSAGSRPGDPMARNSSHRTPEQKVRNEGEQDRNDSRFARKEFAENGRPIDDVHDDAENGRP